MDVHKTRYSNIIDNHTKKEMADQPCPQQPEVIFINHRDKNFHIKNSSVKTMNLTMNCVLQQNRFCMNTRG